MAWLQDAEVTGGMGAERTRMEQQEGAVKRLAFSPYGWNRAQPNRHNQYFPWKTAWLISGQNSFTMLNTPSKAICVTHFWPVFVQVRSLEG